jgi:hypothetical protein
MNVALDAQDFLVLHLALDLLSKQTADELSKARTSAKRLAMTVMRSQIEAVRAKLEAMEGAQ